MTISLLSRQQLEIINRKTLRYPLQIAEKDYFLAVAMQIISESPWGKSLVFKGGTAISHCYLNQYRFSEDLDFSSAEKKISLEELRNIFADVPFLAIKKDQASEATVKIERLQYAGPLEHPNSLKIEIDTLQNVLLAPRVSKYNNVWGLDFKVRVMDVKEICAEKIRAMSERARYRDFYDFFWLMEEYRPDKNKIISFVARKEIRKAITKTEILNNWEIVGSQKVEEIGQIFNSQKVDDDQIKNMIDELPMTEITSIP